MSLTIHHFNFRTLQRNSFFSFQNNTVGNKNAISEDYLNYKRVKAINISKIYFNYNFSDKIQFYFNLIFVV
jgi:hypothetical protein